jgi:hypothetical protein
MVHTRFFHTLEEASREFADMKEGLETILSLISEAPEGSANKNASAAAQAFVRRFP